MNKGNVRRYLNLRIQIKSRILDNKYITDESVAEARGYIKALKDVREELTGDKK